MSKDNISNLTSMPKDEEYYFDKFENGQPLYNKKKNNLPAMGWNSWNAFGSGNTETLTKIMTDKIVELGLDELGYKYVVLDDGCYKPERVDGLLSNEEVKFPSGFKALADYIHGKGLKFGMYNDIGTNLCAGAAVGTCGHEKEDARSYLDWDVDFLKVDNCYYLWDNATFSDPTNAKYVFAPNIRSVELCKPKTANANAIANDNTNANANPETSVVLTLFAKEDGIITGERAHIIEDYVTFIGTWDGTGPDHTPVGSQSSELLFDIEADQAGDYELVVEYATGEEEGVGSFLQIAYEDGRLIFNDFVPVTDAVETFTKSTPISIKLDKGTNRIRFMNHRRQENTLGSYATLVKELKGFEPEKDILLSICEWGKTSPQNWGYKIGDSWRILNDITFQVGSDGDPGVGAWNSDYTTSVLAQYNKAVIMDEFAGLDKGWNDPDMMMIGMNGLTTTMCKTHMTMWCMMNSPLMLGMDLRRMNKGDDLHRIVANSQMVDINQDSLGIQAKRIYSTLEILQPDKEYIREMERADILAKPLSDGSVALSFINISSTSKSQALSVSKSRIMEYIGRKMVNPETFAKASKYTIHDLWKNEKIEMADCVKPDDESNDCDIIFFAPALEPCDNYTIKITPVIK